MAVSADESDRGKGLERRRASRVTTRLTAIYKNLNTGKVRRALTKDISSTGLCLITEELLEVGTLLGVEITLPDRHSPITFTAEVMRSQSMLGPRKSYENPTVETGIKFLGINPKDHAALKQYVTINVLPGF